LKALSAIDPFERINRSPPIDRIAAQSRQSEMDEAESSVANRHGRVILGSDYRHVGAQPIGIQSNMGEVRKEDRAAIHNISKP
jgi:hypothetical protein